MSAKARMSIAEFEEKFGKKIDNPQSNNKPDNNQGLKDLKAIKKLAEEIHMVYTYYSDSKRLKKLMDKLGELLIKEQYRR